MTITTSDHHFANYSGTSLPEVTQVMTWLKGVSGLIHTADCIGQQ